MPPRKSSNARSTVTACAALLPILALGACADYVKRSDTVTAAAGDGLAHNKVVQIDDPWPPNSSNTRIAGHGQRVDKVTKRYLSGGAGAGSSAGSISIAPQMAPPGSGDPRSAQ